MAAGRRSSSIVRGGSGAVGASGSGVPGTPATASAAVAAHLSIYDLLATPPTNPSNVPPAHEWQNVPASELVKDQTVYWIDKDTPVEEACQTLVEHDLLCLLIRTAPGEKRCAGVFDYSDIIAFLLLVLGHGDPETTNDFSNLVKTARQGGRIPVSMVSDLGQKDPFLAFAETVKLGELAEILGSGVRRVAITRSDSTDVIGIFSQQRLVKYLWNNARHFQATESLFGKTVRELQLGSNQVISVPGDCKVLEAFETMNNHGISSLAVIDHQGYLLGNISAVDVKYVTRSSSAHLLNAPAAHYLALIKFEQGLRDGKDSAPHFSISSSSTLGYTVAKLVATGTHRLWMVTGGSTPASAGGTGSGVQNSPQQGHSTLQPPPSSPSPAASVHSATPPPTPGHATMPTAPGSQGGLLQGVVSLTDVIGAFVRSIGVKVDPTEARERRRRTSSSSTAERPVFDRRSFDYGGRR